MNKKEFSIKSFNDETFLIISDLLNKVTKTKKGYSDIIMLNGKSTGITPNDIL